MRMEWTSGTQDAVSEVEEGMRFVRWVAGPGLVQYHTISLCFFSLSAD